MAAPSSWKRRRSDGQATRCRRLGSRSSRLPGRQDERQDRLELGRLGVARAVAEPRGRSVARSRGLGACRIRRGRGGPVRSGPRERGLDGRRPERADPDRADPGQLDEDLLPDRVETKSRLEVGDLGGAHALLGRPEPLARAGCERFRGKQALAIDGIRRPELVEDGPRRRLAGHGGGDVDREPLALGEQPGLALGEGARVGHGPGDPLLVVRGRGHGPGHDRLRLAPGRLAGRPLRGEPVAARPQVGRPRLPGGERRRLVGPAGRGVRGPDGSTAGTLGGFGLEPGHDRPGAVALDDGALGLRSGPPGLARGRFGGSSLGPLGVVGGSPRGRRAGLLGPGGFELGPSSRGGLAGGCRHALQVRGVSPRADRAPSRAAPARRRRSSAPDGRPRAIATGPATAAPSRLTMAQPGGSPGWRSITAARSGTQATRSRIRRAAPDGIAPDGVGQHATTECGQPVEERAVGTRRRARRHVDHDEPALAGQPRDRLPTDQVRPGDLAERGLDGRPECRLHLEVLIQPTAADPARRPGDAPRLLLGNPGACRLEAPAQPGDPRRGRGCGLVGRAARPVGLVGRRPGGLTRRDRPLLQLARLRRGLHARPHGGHRGPARSVAVRSARARSSAARRSASASRRRAASSSETRAASARRSVASSSPRA